MSAGVWMTPAHPCTSSLDTEPSWNFATGLEHSCTFAGVFLKNFVTTKWATGATRDDTKGCASLCPGKRFDEIRHMCKQLLCGAWYNWKSYTRSKESLLLRKIYIFWLPLFAREHWECYVLRGNLEANILLWNMRWFRLVLLFLAGVSAQPGLGAGFSAQKWFMIMTNCSPASEIFFRGSGLRFWPIGVASGFEEKRKTCKELYEFQVNHRFLAQIKGL